ncbi:MAG: hypothetical protein GY928_08145 [Colwellia sp.]|nr:hypothetical protein [Colwellia sp.]
MEVNERLRSKTIECNRLIEADEVVLCQSCDTFAEDLEGARQPDYEGYCSNCNEESNWTVVRLTDYKKRLIELLNKHGE